MVKSTDSNKEYATDFGILQPDPLTETIVANMHNNFPIRQNTTEFGRDAENF